MRSIIAGLMLVAGLGFGRAWTADGETAQALAVSAIKLSADGKPEKARALCYKALAADERCPDALLELGRLSEQDGNLAVAAAFYREAWNALNRAGAARPETAQKLGEAHRRLLALDSFAARAAGIAEDYAQELAGILRASPDNSTRDEVAARVSGLCLDRYVAAEKLPKTDLPPGPAGSAPSAPAVTDNAGTGSRKTPGVDPAAKAKAKTGADKTAAAASVPPDVERALRAPGWTFLTGTWVLVKPGVYEVTDGSLECANASAALSVWIQKGSTGEIGIYMRYCPSHSPPSSSPTPGSAPTEGEEPPYGPGFGFSVRADSWALYGPRYFRASRGFYPGKERSARLTDAPRHNFTISGSESPQGFHMEFNVDGNPLAAPTYKITQEGPFAIVVKGKVTLEQPQAMAVGSSGKAPPDPGIGLSTASAKNPSTKNTASSTPPESKTADLVLPEGKGPFPSTGEILFRRWTTKSGVRQDAKLTGMDGTRVRLTDKDGRMYTIGLSDLVAYDQEYVRREADARGWGFEPPAQPPRQFASLVLPQGHSVVITAVKKVVSGGQLALELRCSGLEDMLGNGMGIFYAMKSSTYKERKGDFGEEVLGKFTAALREFQVPGSSLPSLMSQLSNTSSGSVWAIIDTTEIILANSNSFGSPWGIVEPRDDAPSLPHAKKCTIRCSFLSKDGFDNFYPPYVAVFIYQSGSDKAPWLPLSNVVWIKLE